MKYIINKLKVFFNIKTVLFFLLSSLALSLSINYVTSSRVKPDIAVVDEDKTEMSKRLLGKIVSIQGYKSFESGDKRVYKILKGFETKINNHDYKALIDFKNIDSFELEKANLMIIELITENKVISEINNTSGTYTYKEYDKDLPLTKSLKLLNIKDKPSDIKTDITDSKTMLVFIAVVIFIFVSNLYVNTEIIEERRKLIIERLVINKVRKTEYYVEKLIKVFGINIIFIMTLLTVTKSIDMLSVKIIIAVFELYFYSILLQLLKLDKNTYIVLYMIMFIVFAILYIIPGIGISYMSPIEIISTI